MRSDDDHAVESNPHQCQEDAEIKIPENGKNNNNVCEVFYDTRVSDDGNGLECHSCGDSDETGNFKAGPIYMDKNVTACDLPETLACYHVVKDICVDEGVPVQEKFLFGEKDSVKCSSNSDKVSQDSELCNDLKTNQDVKESPSEGLDDVEGCRSCNQEGLIVTEDDKNSKTDAAILPENVLKESLTLGDILSVEDEQKSPKINNGDWSEEQSLLHLQDEEKQSLETTSLETELQKTEEKLSSVSTTTSQDSDKIYNNLEYPKPENQQQNHLLNSYEDGKLYPSGFGETSFSAAEQVSGHITYSGTIAISGSLSVRSDASTASGRSFAFPILQSEWNSSPVRMAKAEKRREKRWRDSFLCCRFS